MVPSLSRRALLRTAAAGSAAVVAGQPAVASTPPPFSVGWSRTYTSDAERSLVRDVVRLDESRLLLVGGVSREYRRPFGWVALADDAGDIEWEQDGGVPGRFLWAAVPTDDGAVLAGRLNGSSGIQRDPTSDDGDSSPWVLHVTDRGDVTWTRMVYPEADSGTAQDLTKHDGGYVVGGSVTIEGRERPWARHLSADGSVNWEWQHTEGRTQAVASATDGVILGGSVGPSGGSEDAWVARLADGTETWYREPATTEGQSRVEALAPRDGGVLAVGQRGFGNPQDNTGWAVALDADGETVWEQTYPRDQWHWVKAVTPYEDGYVLLGTQETEDGSTRGAWLLHIDDTGAVLKETLLTDDSDGYTRGYSVEPTPDGGLFVGGDRKTAGTPDGWLARLGDSGKHRDERRWSPPTVPDWGPALLAGAGLGAAGATLFSWLRDGEPIDES